MSMFSQHDRPSRRHAMTAVLGAAAVGLFLAAGCTHLRWPTGKASVPEQPAVRVSGQYRPTMVPGVGCVTYEAYLTNNSRGPLAFTAASLDGHDLWKDKPANVIWFQFYPTTDLARGQTIVFQICFREAPKKLQRLELRDFTEGLTTVPIPSFHLPKRFITAVTYSGDFRRVFVQVETGGAVPAVIEVNGRTVKSFSRLAGGDAPKDVEMLAFDAPFRIGSGMPLHVRVLFLGGGYCHSLVRALGGIVLDGFSVTGAPPPPELGLDADPAVVLLKSPASGDVACSDVKARTDGANAPAATAARFNAFRSDPTHLSAIHYCTGTYTCLWAIYGAVPDAVLVNPYSFGYTPTVSRFIEEELQYIRRGRESIRPRPLLYIPETCRRHQRFLEAPELQVLAWSAILEGAKGLKYFHFDSDSGNTGLLKSPTLTAAVQDLNAQVRERNSLLVPLVLVSTSTVKTGGASMEITQAWAGDAGVLLLLRNLDYKTDGEDDQMGKAPRFVVKGTSDVSIHVGLPEWLSCTEAVDFLTGEQLCPIPAGTRAVDIRIGRLDAMRLVWIPGRKASPLPARKLAQAGRE